jgi:hypothetical protein
MKPLTEKARIEHYQALVREMTLSDPNRSYEFKDEWVRSQGWKVVPVEDASHFSPDEIATLIAVLRGHGHNECIAVATESLDPAPACYQLSVSEEDLQAFNKECGLFRYLLMDDDRTWAISCNEWYNLFGAQPKQLEALLGKPIDEARAEYLSYATALAKKPDEPLLQVATHYATL